MKPIIIISLSTDQTIAIGRAVGRQLKQGDIVCLYGDLGSGKTILCKGIANGCSAVFGSRPATDERDVTSPSYTIINEYNGLRPIQDSSIRSKGSMTPFYHIDLYRLSDIQSIEDIGIFEYLNNESIAVIEWAERLQGHIECSIKINIEYIDNNSRRISILGIDEEDWNNCKD